MLAGTLTNLRGIEAADVKVLGKWLTRKRFYGPFGPPYEAARAELPEKWKKGKFDTWFILENKAGKRVGLIFYYRTPKQQSLSIDYRVCEARWRRLDVTADAIRTLAAYLLTHYEDVGVVHCEADGADRDRLAALAECGFVEYKRAQARGRVGLQKVYLRLERARAETVWGRALPVPAPRRHAPALRRPGAAPEG